jgi:hypothetical protein
LLMIGDPDAHRAQGSEPIIGTAVSQDYLT